jgi:pilus assembly protein TadC
MYAYVREAWKHAEESGVADLQWERMQVWRDEGTVVRVDRPTRIDRAHALGYKAKQGIAIARVKVHRGGRRASRYVRGRRTAHMGVRKKTPAKSLQRIAEERKANPAFTFARDGVHPDAAGHRVMAEPLAPMAKSLEHLFPQLEWELKRAGINVEPSQFLAVALYVPASAFLAGLIISVVPLVINGSLYQFYLGVAVSVCLALLVMFYLFMIPSTSIKRRTILIDRDLEYMLKDVQIQLNSGIPLFDTLVNVSRGGYGECSRIADGVVQEVQSGRSMGDVLEDVGMWSPSEYLRKSLWQIVNALKAGSDVVLALSAISNDIRLEKEDRIRSYSKELNLWGLIFMMGGVILPSMGVTLLVILSSFMGGAVINETLFWLILIGLILFHIIFITFVKEKRPII